MKSLVSSATTTSRTHLPCFTMLMPPFLSFRGRWQQPRQPSPHIGLLPALTDIKLSCFCCLPSYRIPLNKTFRFPCCKRRSRVMASSNIFSPRPWMHMNLRICRQDESRKYYSLEQLTTRRYDYLLGSNFTSSRSMRWILMSDGQVSDRLCLSALPSSL